MLRRAARTDLIAWRSIHGEGISPGTTQLAPRDSARPARLARWLAPRGLSFNEDKTKIVHLTEGFDFLGFNVRRYPGGKLTATAAATW